MALTPKDSNCMFADLDSSDFIMAERVVGPLGLAQRGQYGSAEKFIRWVSQKGLEKPAFTTIGRWRHGEEASYHAPVYIPWLTFDLDGVDPIETRQDVMDILGVLDLEGYDMRRVYVSYSGKKGFHVQVSAKQFGGPVFEDCEAATSFLRVWLENVSEGAEWDQSVTAPQSLIRVTGSKHGDTDAYKRTWYAENFQQLSLERILSNVRQSRSFDFIDEDDSIEPGARNHLRSLLPEAKQLLDSMRTDPEDKAESKGVISSIKPGLLEGQIFGEKPFHVGRENGAYIIGCWYLERYSERHAWQKLQNWNKRNDPPLPRGRLKIQFRGAKRTIYDQKR